MQRYLTVSWYFRAEETVHAVSRTFYEREVFKTAHVYDHVVEDFIERCCVYAYQPRLLAADSTDLDL